MVTRRKESPDGRHRWLQYMISVLDFKGNRYLKPDGFYCEYCKEWSK